MLQTNSHIVISFLFISYSKYSVSGAYLLISKLSSKSSKAILLDKIKYTMLELEYEYDIDYELMLYKDKIENYLSALGRNINIRLNVIETKDHVNYVDVYELTKSLVSIIALWEMEYESNKLAQLKKDMVSEHILSVDIKVDGISIIEPYYVRARKV